MLNTDDLLVKIYHKTLSDWFLDEPYYYGTKQKEETTVRNNPYEEMTLTANGLADFVQGLVSLLKNKRTVEKVAPDTGRYYNVTEEIPAEELFTIVEIRNGNDGKFVVRANVGDLDQMTKRDMLKSQVAKFESK